MRVEKAWLKASKTVYMTKELKKPTQTATAISTAKRLFIQKLGGEGFSVLDERAKRLICLLIPATLSQL